MKITTRSGAVAFFMALRLRAGRDRHRAQHHLDHSLARSVVPVAIGIVLFALIIAGLIVNTVFVVREIRRNEQYDSFLNAVTHELRTSDWRPSGLYLETLQSREVTDAQRQRVLLPHACRHRPADGHRGSGAARAPKPHQKRRERNWSPVDLPDAAARMCGAGATGISFRARR